MIPMEQLAQEAARISSLQVEADGGSLRALREIDERRADLNADALAAIQAELSGQHYTSETTEAVATILRAIGLPVRDVEDAGAQHFAVVVVLEERDAGFAFNVVEEAVAGMEKVVYVGGACPLGQSFGGAYSTTQVCLASGDRRGLLIAAPGQAPRNLDGVA